MDQKDIALEYARNGIQVFPCRFKTKSPLTKGGYKDATTDEHQIISWWTKHPTALIGHPCTELIVIDFDTYNAPDAAISASNMIKTQIKSELGMGFPVQTKSGGTHWYYKNSGATNRMIKSLPLIDVLGIGGYVILPDQKTYVATESDTPWERIADSISFDQEAYAAIATAMEPLTKSINEMVKEYRQSKSPAAQKKAKTPNTQKTSSTKDNAPHPCFNNSEEKEKEINFVSSGMESRAIRHVDIETGEITFEGGKDEYYVRTSEDYIPSDPSEKILVNGKIKIEPYSLDKESLNRIFHNHQVQQKLAKFLGFSVPALGNDSNNHSVFPGHTDNKKSMGLRWDQKKTHLIARDFANFHGTSEDKKDYNLVRIYAAQKYKANPGRLSNPEFYVWFFRLMFEAGVLDLDVQGVIDSLPQQDSVKKMKKMRKKALYEVVLLDQIKRLHKKYDEKFLMACSFWLAWSSSNSVSTAWRRKLELAHMDFIRVTGWYNCVPSRDDNFFSTIEFAFNFEERDGWCPATTEPAPVGVLQRIHAAYMDVISVESPEHITVNTPVEDKSKGEKFMHPLLKKNFDDLTEEEYAELRAAWVRGELDGENDGEDPIPEEDDMQTTFIRSGDTEEYDTTVSTVVAARFDDHNYQKLKNFMQDVGVDEIMDQEDMFVPFFFTEANVPIEKASVNQSFRVDGISVWLLPSYTSGENRLCLLIESGDLEDAARRLDTKYENFLIHYGEGLTTMNFLKEGTAENIDWDMVNLKMEDELENEFALSDVFVKKTPTESVLDFLDGNIDEDGEEN